MAGAQGVQFFGGLARHSGIRGADARAVDLYRRVHCRNRPRRNPVRSYGTDGGGSIARAAARLQPAADRGAAGNARHSAAAYQPVPEPDQELFARGSDRISGSGFGICWHHTQPDRTGDRNSRHHDGRLSAALAGDQRDHEFLRLADRPESRSMSDIEASSFVRQELVPERAAPLKTTGLVGFLRTRLFNSPTNILLTLASLLLLWFTVVPTIRFLLVDAVWRGTDRSACLGNAGHAVGACWPYVQAKFT